VADAHRRFVISVDGLEEAASSARERIEALEVHTRRTDARLTELVDAKLAEVAGAPVAALAEMRTVVDGLRTHLHAALDAHLVATREDVARALDGSLGQLSSRAAELEEAAASVEAGLRAAEQRIVETADANDRRLTAAQEESQETLAGVVARVDGLVRAAAAEAGALAPLRSDVRHLKAQVAELADLVAELRPKRKAPAKKAPAPAAAPAAKKAPAARRRTQ